jgi:hypothetical protein
MGRFIFLTAVTLAINLLSLSLAQEGEVADKTDEGIQVDATGEYLEKRNY